MIRLLFITIAFSVFVVSCANDKRVTYSLRVEHYAGGPGLSVVYELDEKGIRVNTNCDLVNCEEKTLYESSFTKVESDSIFNFLNSLRLDTLRSSYETAGMDDGLFTRISFKKLFFYSSRSTFQNYDTPTTASLFKFMDELITIKKYKFYTWGRES